MSQGLARETNFWAGKGDVKEAIFLASVKLMVIKIAEKKSKEAGKLQL